MTPSQQLDLGTSTDESEYENYLCVTFQSFQLTKQQMTLGVVLENNCSEIYTKVY